MYAVNACTPYWAARTEPRSLLPYRLQEYHHELERAASCVPLLFPFRSWYVQLVLATSRTHVSSCCDVVCDGSQLFLEVTSGTSCEESGYTTVGPFYCSLKQKRHNLRLTCCLFPTVCRSLVQTSARKRLLLSIRNFPHRTAPLTQEA